MTDPTDWIGRQDHRSGGVEPRIAALMAVALAHPDSAPVVTDPGSPLPPLWHWAGFPDATPSEGLGPDGHPRLGGFLPALPYPRRMWAGGRVAFAGQLVIGETLSRDSRILAIELKTGASGPMAFVTVRHLVRGAAGQIDEQHDLVYLPAATAFNPPRKQPAPQAVQPLGTVPMDPVRLFRYSAATGNGHRIHYDRAYATGTEHYPGLVVHGPMQATLLAEAGQRLTGRPPRHFAYRGLHPVFDDAPLRLLGWQPEGTGGAVELCTLAPQGHRALQARYEP